REFSTNTWNGQLNVFRFGVVCSLELTRVEIYRGGLQKGPILSATGTPPTPLKQSSESFGLHQKARAQEYRVIQDPRVYGRREPAWVAFRDRWEDCHRLDCSFWDCLLTKAPWIATNVSGPFVFNRDCWIVERGFL